MKKYVIDFFAGVILLIIVILIMKFITLDLRVITLIAAIFLCFYSYLTTPKRNVSLLSIFLVTLPISIGFVLGILPELPSMWISILIFFYATLLGNWIHSKKIAILGVLPFFFFSYLIVPKLVTNNLFQLVNEIAPSVSMESISTQEKINLDDFKGKIVVIDFFGTWCAPCIKEMEELKELKKKYKNRTDIEFLLVCTEFAKDNPEKAKRFIEKRDLNFKAYFDFKNEAHKLFGFTGVPALVILDKENNIRLKHEGYNESEDLKGNLIKLIELLSNSQ
ncbi:TlpA family protein disulfide reductase [Croceitalea marina]|uniref:TlpA family protein disulfide reductase n=1 Tax=Croceitalea marina TaxID=1775166 RepID=A0ABW5MZQ9_9FLAO